MTSSCLSRALLCRGCVFQSICVLRTAEQLRHFESVHLCTTFCFCMGRVPAGLLLSDAHQCCQRMSPCEEAGGTDQALCPLMLLRSNVCGY